MISNLKIIVFEDCKAATYEYYVGEEKDIIKVFRSNVDSSVWEIVSRLVHEYFQLGENDTEFDPDSIEYWMLEKADLGYIEEEDIAVYCDSAIGYNYKKNEAPSAGSWMYSLPKRADGESSLKDIAHEKE